MTEDEYIEQRLDDQIAWYGKKSARNKKLHLNLNTTIIVCAAAIPAFSAFTTGELYDPAKYIIAILGVLTATLTGITSLWKFQEKWTIYRSTAEALEREKILYLTKTAPYDKAEMGFAQFVRNVERIMNAENSSWTELINSEQAAASSA